MTSADRAWYRALPLFGIAVAAMTILTLVLGYNGTPPGWGYQATITFTYLFPGLLLSIGVSQLILRRRGKPRVVTTAERVLIGTLVGLTLALALTSIDKYAFIGLLLGPLIIILAIALTITIAVTNRQLKRASAVPVKP